MSAPTYVVTDPSTGLEHLIAWPGDGYAWFCRCGSVEGFGKPCYAYFSMLHTFDGLCADDQGVTVEYPAPKPVAPHGTWVPEGMWLDHVGYLHDQSGMTAKAGEEPLHWFDPD